MQDTQLFWPTHIFEKTVITTEDRIECPTHACVIDSYRYFRKAKPLPSSKIFWKAFREATIVYFTDRYFIKDGIHEILLEEILQAKEERRRTPQNIVIFSDVCDKSTLQSNIQHKFGINNIKECIIEILSFPNNYNIHDRFALFDDNIWHCGATIGGTHGAFHAISGPWKDIDGRMGELFGKMKFSATIKSTKKK